MEDECAKPTMLLIVDDDEAITSSLASLLQSDAVVVQMASSWDQAVELLHTQVFDVVITDLRLRGVTGMEGLDLISLIKAQAPRTRVALLTGYGSPEVEREARARGADAYLEKTLPISVILERVRALGVPTGSADSEKRLSITGKEGGELT